MFTVVPNISHEVEANVMPCDVKEMTQMLHVNSTNISLQFILTLSAVAVFVGTRQLVGLIRQKLAQLTVVVIGAGPVGLTAALISVQCNKVKSLVIFEEQSKYHVKNRSYQISILPENVDLLRSNGVDFDNLEGIWRDGCFYTRVGIYLEYIINVLPLYQTAVEFKFNTKFSKDNSDAVDKLPGRKLVICCDGSTGQAARALGISDECIQHSSGVYGAVAAIDRPQQTLVPTAEQRIHNLSFDLTAYGSSACDENGKFSLKIFGNSRCIYLALAVHKSDSSVVKALKTVIDKSMMRNIFLKCFNTYKSAGEPSISDSYCLNKMKFSPRLYDIKLSQRMESVAYISDCDTFLITEGEAARSYNFNTGMDINLGFKGISPLLSFIEMIAVAETEHSILKALIYKMEFSDRIVKNFLRHGLQEYVFS